MPPKRKSHSASEPSKDAGPSAPPGSGPGPTTASDRVAKKLRPNPSKNEKKPKLKDADLPPKQKPSQANTKKPPVETQATAPTGSTPGVEASSKPASASKPLAPRKRRKIVRLALPRPFPQVPSGSNATGPYSTRGEGKNRLGVTRQHELGGYLRRCKELVEIDGYRSIHLSAIGAAISHALLISSSLPTILASTFSPSDIKVNINTGTVECVDEIIPDEADEDEDEGGMQIRHKSGINIDIIIGDGVRAASTARDKRNKGKQKAKSRARPNDGKSGDVLAN